MLLIFFLIVLLILLFGSIYYAHRWSKNLTVRVSFTQSAIYAGNTAELVETIENRKRLPVPVLEIGFRIQKGIRYLDAENTQVSDYNYKRDIFSILGMEHITRRYRIVGEKRGRYNISGISCSAPDLLFRKRLLQEEPAGEDPVGGPDGEAAGAPADRSGNAADKHAAAADRGESRAYTGSGGSFVVYCRRIPCNAVLHAVEVILGEKESTRRVYEDPFAFSSIREYTIRDPLKTVNWKASAKTGSLMVNTYNAVRSDKVIIFMDPHTGGNRYGEVLLEGTLCLTATLCQKLLEKSQTVGLVTGKIEKGVPVVFPPGTGRARLSEIEYFLTGSFTDDNTAALEDLLGDGRLKGPRGFSGRDRSLRSADGMDTAVCIFISANDTPSLRAQIRDFVGNRTGGILVVPCTGETKAVERSTEGIHVLSVRVDGLV